MISVIARDTGASATVVASLAEAAEGLRNLVDAEGWYVSCITRPSETERGLVRLRHLDHPVEPYIEYRGSDSEEMRRLIEVANDTRTTLLTPTAT